MVLHKNLKMINIIFSGILALAGTTIAATGKQRESETTVGYFMR